MRILRVFLSLLLTAQIWTVQAKIAQSSIPSLNFPWGARSTGMAETFTGVADNSESIFYNPAGLGLAPLADSWIRYDDLKQSYEHLSSAELSTWAVDTSGRIYRFGGGSFLDHDVHYIDSGETLEDIAARYLDIADSRHIADAADSIRRFNDLEEGKRDSVMRIISSYDVPNADSLVLRLLSLGPDQRDQVAVYAEIAEVVSPEEGDSLAGEISAVLRDDMGDIEDLYSLKIPYSIGPRSKIHHICARDEGVLWVATDNGLWRYSDSWKRYDTYDGLPADRILSITPVQGGDLLIGTEDGAARYAGGTFTPLTARDQSITGPVYKAGASSDGIVYLATDSGLYEVDSQAVRVIDTADGLYSNRITALHVDWKDRVWAAGDGGVALLRKDGVKRFSLGRDTRVNAIAGEGGTAVWIATDLGVSRITEEVNQETGRSSWVINVYHAKNNLASSHAAAVSVGSNGDIWIATDRSVERYRQGRITSTVFFENLLPDLNLSDLWHAAVAGTYPIGEWGAVGFTFKQLYFGEVEGNYDATGQNNARNASFEIATGLSYGFSLRRDLALGLNLKYAFSRLEKDEAEARTVAVDAGILKRNLLVDDLDFGFMLKNMGPAVSYSENEVSNPIPFLARVGVSYTPIDKPGSRLLIALDADREIVYRGDDGESYNFLQALYYDLLTNKDGESAATELEEVILHGGVEYLYADFLSLRTGYMHDDAGSRTELSMGVGVELNQLIADISIIISTLGDDDQVRQGQTRFSITYNP
ncbi:MAG: PorV/PorQ family protein [Fibrobacterota bacterium]